MDLSKVSMEDLQNEMFLRHPLTELFAKIEGKTIDDIRKELDRQEDSSRVGL